LAARTSIGKTQIGCQIATALCSKGLTVGFISAELDYTQIEARLLSSLSRKLLGKHGYHWRSSGNGVGYVSIGELQVPNPEDKEQITNLLGTLACELQNCDGELIIEAPWGACVDTVVNSMRSMKARKPELRAVVLDHFHVLSRHNKAARDGAAMLEERAYRLMTAAKELDIDLFVLAQMNTVGIKREQDDMKSQPKPPELDQIRGTDALSHVSHAVWLVRKQRQVEGEPSDQKLELWHSKVRGRQAFWEGSPPQEQITTVQGFVQMSVIQLDYHTASLKADDTMQHVNVFKSSRFK
jgi:replicative DNA helicase